MMVCVMTRCHVRCAENIEWKGWSLLNVRNFLFMLMFLVVSSGRLHPIGDDTERCTPLAGTEDAELQAVRWATAAPPHNSDADHSEEGGGCRGSCKTARAEVVAERLSDARQAIETASILNTLLGEICTCPDASRVNVEDVWESFAYGWIAKAHLVKLIDSKICEEHVGAWHQISFHLLKLFWVIWSVRGQTLSNVQCHRYDWMDPGSLQDLGCISLGADCPGADVAISPMAPGSHRIRLLAKGHSHYLCTAGSEHLTTKR
mmetsp:Transcript_64260/g.118374  ORF Transcript_64260/g.118374 Transcript_64260/m.118374 type:complete len:261 (+) Transcript_64260:2524-3306(+)